MAQFSWQQSPMMPGGHPTGGQPPPSPFVAPGSGASTGGSGWGGRTFGRPGGPGAGGSSWATNPRMWRGAGLPNPQNFGKPGGGDASMFQPLGSPGNPGSTVNQPARAPIGQTGDGNTMQAGDAPRADGWPGTPTGPPLSTNPNEAFGQALGGIGMMATGQMGPTGAPNSGFMFAPGSTPSANPALGWQSQPGSDYSQLGGPPRAYGLPNFNLMGQPGGYQQDGNTLQAGGPPSPFAAPPPSNPGDVTMPVELAPGVTRSNPAPKAASAPDAIALSTM